MGAFRNYVCVDYCQRCVNLPLATVVLLIFRISKRKKSSKRQQPITANFDKNYNEEKCGRRKDEKSTENQQNAVLQSVVICWQQKTSTAYFWMRWTEHQCCNGRMSERYFVDLYRCRVDNFWTRPIRYLKSVGRTKPIELIFSGYILQSTSNKFNSFVFQNKTLINSPNILSSKWNFYRECWLQSNFKRQKVPIPWYIAHTWGISNVQQNLLGM